MDALRFLASALGHAKQPSSGLNALARTLQDRFGYRLFTVLVLDAGRDHVRRHFSSLPDDYPPGGTKPMRKDSEFFRTVVEQGLPRLCSNREECLRAFPDHELIFSLGCESAVNVPVRWNGTTIGSLNLLHRAGWYSDAMLPELSWYSALAVPIVQQAIATP